MDLLRIEIPYNHLRDLSAIHFVEKIEKTLKEQVAKDKTWEYILFFSESVKTASRALLQMLNARTRAALENIPIIMYPSQELNAWIAKPFSGKGHYIFLDSDLYRNLAYFIDLNIGRTSDSDWVGIFNLFMNSAFKLNIPLPKPDEKTPLFKSEGGQYTFVRMVYFILAHEYSHFLLGHFENDANFVLRNLGLSQQKVYSSDQEAEFEADKKAIKLLLEAFPGHEEALFNVVVGCAMFFTYIDAVEFLVDYVNTKKGSIAPPGSESHPRAIDRLKRIEEQVKSIVPKRIWKARAMDISINMNTIEVLERRYTSQHAKGYLKMLAENYLQHPEVYRGAAAVIWKLQRSDGK